MKYAYLTVDIEEWYQLDYLKDYNLENTGIEVVPQIIEFLDMLDELQIKATFFIVANIAEKHADILREIVARGHAIGCHGLDHTLLYEKENGVFIQEIKEAKNIIENIAKCKVFGYRAPCFSMQRDKLELLKKAGFKYDSSKINFRQHRLYGDLDLGGYKKIDDLVYLQDDFIEYEIPTIQIGKYEIPISGGGYLRLFPFWVIKQLIKTYARKQKNFLVYLHPFELTDIPLNFPTGVGLKNKLRATIGRKNNLNKIKKVILLLKKLGAEFRTLQADRAFRLQMED